MFDLQNDNFLRLEPSNADTSIHKLILLDSNSSHRGSISIAFGDLAENPAAVAKLSIGPVDSDAAGRLVAFLQAVFKSGLVNAWLELGWELLQTFDRGRAEDLVLDAVAVGADLVVVGWALEAGAEWDFGIGLWHWAGRNGADGQEDSGGDAKD